MGILDIFRRRPSVRDVRELAQFIDENAAFLVQKGIFEYSRARAGHYAKVLFSEQTFLDAIERSRWRAYPLGLAMVAELVSGVLGRHDNSPKAQLVERVRALTLSVFDRYPTPASLDDRDWRDLRTELDRRLQLIGLHAPKRAFEVADPFARIYFDLMPIHKKLRGQDFPTTHNYLRIVLCNIHDELTKRMDAEALVASLQED